MDGCDGTWKYFTGLLRNATELVTKVSYASSFANFAVIVSSGISLSIYFLGELSAPYFVVAAAANCIDQECS